MNSNQNVIIDLKNGNKCEGILVNIDKERMVINLSNAKRITTNEDGTKREENFPKLEISKEDIKEVKIVQFEAKEDIQKKESGNINAIPQNLQNNAEIAYNKNRSYNKGDSFFDGLTPMSNLDAKNESIRYNDKNCETFDLPKSAMNDNFSTYSSSRRGGYRGNNRGNYRGNNRRGGNNFMGNNRPNNYNNFNNNQYRNQNQNQNQRNFNNNFRGGYNNNFRGNSRGGFNNQFQGQRSNYNDNQFDNFSNNPRNQFFDNGRNFENKNTNYQFNKQQQMFGTPNFDNDSQFSGFDHSQNSGNFGGFSQRGRGEFQFQRGGRGQNRNFRGNNRNRNDNRIKNPEFDSLNENYEDQLDDGYVMSIYDKPSISGHNNYSQNMGGNLSIYDSNKDGSTEVTKSLYDN
jgi:small nuclear ribonucleoprotein (snRNP)-like protein